MGGGGGRFTLFAAKCSAFEWIARFWCDPFALLIVVLAGLGTAHILVRTATYGAAVGWDASLLLSTAINFLAGEGWQDLRGKPLVLWPPLFPLLLAALGWLGIEPFAAGRWINATAFGLTTLVAGCWLHSHLRSRLLGLAATATIAASLPLSDLAANFRTDPLFILFTLLALIQWAAFLHRGGRTPWLWAAVFTALAAVTRWPGGALIGVGVLLLLPLARLKHTVVFGAISSLPLLGVLAHNWAVTGNLTDATGKRAIFSSGQSLSAGLSQIVEVFGAWVVPRNAPDGLAYLLWLAVGGVGLAGATVVLRATRMHRAGRRQDLEAAPAYSRLEPAIPFGVFAVAYPVFLVAVVPFTVAQKIDSRYLLPVYVPLLVVVALLLDRFLSIETTGRMAIAKGRLVSLVLLGALAHTGFSVHRNLRITHQAWRAGVKDWMYNSPYWEPSETLKYIRTNLNEGRVYTNNVFLTWFWDRTAALGKHQPLPQGRIHRVMPHIMRRTDSTNSHIVWLQHQKPSYAYDALDLRCLPGVEPVAELSDGVVFRLTTAATEPFDADRHRTCKQRYVERLLAQVGERVVRSGWDVYRNGHRLTYLKQPCASDDVQAKFVLHVTPADPGGLSRSRQRYGFDNLGFHFNWRGIRRGDQCIAIAHLPNYLIDRIRVGQWIAKENRTLWDAAFSPSR